MAGDMEDVAVEEAVISLVRAALDAAPACDSFCPRTRCLIRRMKEYLAARLACRLRLADIARAVCGSPAYLTAVFRRAEGLPLHQYVPEIPTTCPASLIAVAAVDVSPVPRRGSSSIIC